MFLHSGVVMWKNSELVAVLEGGGLLSRAEKLQCKMEQKVEIKEEPVWLEEETASTSFDNYELISREMHLKEETKSKFAEPGQTQSTFEPFANAKDEICIDEHTAGQLVPCFKEEDNVGNVALLRRGPVDTCGRRCKVLKNRSETICNLAFHDVCNLRLSSDSGEKSVHPIRQRENCFVACGTTFPKKSYLRRHLRIRTRGNPHSLTDFGKCFGDRTRLSRQDLSHTGNPPYSCDDCSIRCFSKSELIKHQRTHPRERPYCCNECGKRFYLKSNVKDHMIIHTGVRPYSCNDCDKRFRKKSALTQHVLTHANERLHSCNECAKKFSRKSHLERHLLRHIRGRSHCCTDCGKKFATETKLRMHLITHTRVLSYSCERCGKAYSRKSYLRRHLLTHT
ncbi:zinc finger protein 391 isoform X1 [Anabrus simplex]|uniref:zinc finger protein 391 isoform X1 n=2 Tax=Anabrus simplex TaxID=316456 RepID=UPI0035A2C368